MGSFSKPRIIEFCGLPGSGKSTIAQVFCREYLCGNTDIYYYSDLPKSTERKCLLTPRFLLIFIKLILQSFQLFKQVNFRHIYGMVVILYNYSNFMKTKQGILIVDQGIVQKVLSIAYLCSIDDTKAYKVLQIVLHGYEQNLSCVHVTCDEKETIHRLQHRGYVGARFNDLNSERLKYAMGVQAENLSVIKNTLINKYPHIKQFSLNSIISIGENMTILKKYIYD